MNHARKELIPQVLEFTEANRHAMESATELAELVGASYSDGQS